MSGFAFTIGFVTTVVGVIAGLYAVLVTFVHRQRVADVQRVGTPVRRRELTSASAS
jgi:hypothetical protein